MKLTPSLQPWGAMRGAVLCTAVAVLPWAAMAANLEIDPVRIELSPQQKSATITIRNNSDQPTTLEIKPVTWSQVGSRDVYEPTRELLVSPPVFTIPPNGAQIVRAALRRQADPAMELTYRINLQELPAPLATGGTGVQVALRIGLPVFVQPKGSKAVPKMEWNVARKPDGNLMVGLRNPGNAHIQVTDFSLLNPGSNGVVAETQGSTYVLAGQSREWNLQPSATEKITGARLRLKAFTDAGDADKELPVVVQ